MSSYRPQYSTQIGLGGRITPGVKAIVIANVAVFAVQVLVFQITRTHIVEVIFGLTSGDVLHGYVWQLVTYMFLHSIDWLTHLLLNMLMFWAFGVAVERVWGTREFVKYYFICGIGAGLTTCLLFPESRTIGASGAVFGVMLAFALLYPNRQILFWYMFPMRAISVVLLCLGIELYSLLSLGDGVAHFAHLGGMLFGWLYLKRAWRLREFWNELRWRLRRRRFRVMRRDDERRYDPRYPFH